MNKFEFSIASIDRIELRDPDSNALKQLNAMGSRGWHIAYVREDAQHNRNLLFIMEREEGLGT